MYYVPVILSSPYSLDPSDKADFMSALSGYGTVYSRIAFYCRFAGEQFILVFLVLEDNEITESRNSLEIIEGRNSLERIVEGRNSPTKTITREQWELRATVLFFSAVAGLECAQVASARLLGVRALSFSKECSSLWLCPVINCPT
jgi:hypothetical protein